ncbi:MAG: TraX family protein [Caldicoprobacterales bacterium]|jgi:hypothetical protein|nr:hypothetical protein [Clostridiales bacterium]
MIKLIAMAAMLIDHIGAVFFPQALWLRIIGRISFPMFAWGVAMGYIRTRNWKMYAIRLTAIGLITQLPYSLLFQSRDLNVCFTLLAGLLALKVLHLRRIWIRAVGLTCILSLVHLLNFEYGIYGVLTILVFYYYQEDRNLPLYQGILTLGGILVYRFHEIQLFSIISSFIIPVVRGKDYRLNRALQYGFYPIHIVLLLLIKMFIRG